jgi:hypothetical protein
MASLDVIGETRFGLSFQRVWEICRFKAVMQHPEFKANPLKAIRQHVENTWEKKEGMAL